MVARLVTLERDLPRPPVLGAGVRSRGPWPTPRLPPVRPRRGVPEPWRARRPKAMARSLGHARVDSQGACAPLGDFRTGAPEPRVARGLLLLAA
jgi:hypothetical protein